MAQCIKVTRKGQVTIPIELERRLLGIRSKATEVQFARTSDGSARFTRISPCTPVLGRQPLIRLPEDRPEYVWQPEVLRNTRNHLLSESKRD